MSNQKTSIFIDIISQLKGNGLKQAGSELTAFENLAMKAAKTFKGVLSVSAVADFGKASVQAFAADQKALALLDQSLKNVGLSLSSPDVNKFVEEMSTLYGVTKDDLIPAFQTLLRYTGSITQSQRLTKLAMDVAAGTGKDLATVSTALGKAYGGNVTSLSKLGTGLTKAELQSKNFEVIQKRLTSLFKNDAAAAADTFAGKVNRLKIGFHEMEVQIGKGLTSAFDTLTGAGGSIDNAITMMNNLGTAIGNDITEAAHLISLLGKIPGGKSIVKAAVAPIVDGVKSAVALAKNVIAANTATIDLLTGRKNRPSGASGIIQAEIAKAAQQRKAEDTAKAKADAAALAELKKKLALQYQDNALAKAALALKQSQKVFDQQAAELWAATHSQQTAADQQRLQLMNDQAALQDAIDQKDATLATNLAARVTEEQKNIMLVNQSLNEIGISTNPLQPLLDALDQGKITLDEMVKDYLILTNGMATVPSLSYNYGTDPFNGGSAGNGGLPSYATGGSLPTPMYSFNPTPSFADPTGNLAVTVYIGDQAVTDAVATSTQNASATGTQIITSRLNTPAIA